MTITAPMPAVAWTVTDIITINGRQVDRETEVTISGEGRFRFLRHVTTAAGTEWVDVYGGKKGHETIRSFRPARIKRVHRLSKMRGGA